MLKKILFFSFFLILGGNYFALALPQNIEDVVQQLDWDMTRPGKVGKKYRNAAVQKLVCLGQWGSEERERVLQTAGRLLGHENSVIVTRVIQLITQLNAIDEIDEYKQKMLIRYGHPDSDHDVQETLHALLYENLEGIEVIKEFYPTPSDVRYLNQLAKNYKLATEKTLKVRLRTLSDVEPTLWEEVYIGSIQASVEKDFHIYKSRIPDDFLCEKESFVWPSLFKDIFDDK